MKRLLSRSLSIALITLLFASSIDYLTGMETSLGLDTLFLIRGARQPPGQVVVVAMDEPSEIRLGLGQDLTRWRDFHSQLIKQLQSQGVALIVFDLQFIASHADHDLDLAAAMRTAGNVLLTDCVQKLRRGVEDFYGRDECSSHNQLAFVQKVAGPHPLSEHLVAMRKVSATPVLAEAALDHAPFYLSNDADNPTIREAWTFLDELAETPSLPVLTWAYYLQRTGALTLSPIDHPLSTWLSTQRRQCRQTGKTTAKLSSIAQRVSQAVCADNSRFLNFYGPPQTLRMVSYSDVFDGKVTDLQGKVVFIGKANRQYSPGKTDYFQTPLSNSRSGKMAGVEIMATHFANLLEDREIVSAFPHSLVLLVIGLLIGALLIQFPGIAGLSLSLILGGIYAVMAVWYFKSQDLWLPIAVPLLVQLPLAWLISLLWSRRDLLAERKRILDFILRVQKWRRFIPSRAGEWYPETEAIEAESEIDVTGLCLATDIEGYTTVAANHHPHAIWELLNAYYQVLGHPVSVHNGLVTDVAGDAMIAVWTDLPVANQRLAACLAALEMQLAVEQFNATSTAGRLPTRIGLHEGDMTLGELHAGDSSYYRAIGDTVNTASRIQGVNKYLGTRILASAAITANLANINYRPVGAFRLVGRDEPIHLVEVIGIASAANVDTGKHQAFAMSLQAIQQGQWQNAVAGFETLLQQYGEDGPSQFYLNLALGYRENPPLDWDGVVSLEGK